MEVLRDIYYFSIPLLQTICVFLLPFCIFYLIRKMGAARSFFYSSTSHGSAEVIGDTVVEKDDDNFKEREDNETERSSRGSKRGLIDTKPKEREKENGKQEKISDSMNLKNTNEEGTAKKEDTKVAMEKIVSEKENKAKLDDGAVEKRKREKIYEEGDNEEIKQVNGKSEVSNKDGQLRKEENKQNDKRIMAKAEICNEIVEKVLKEQSIGKAVMAAVENVNKREIPGNRPAVENVNKREISGNRPAVENVNKREIPGNRPAAEKVETEQAEGDRAMAKVSGIEKGEESNRMVERANGPELAAGEEINTNVYDNGERVAEENSSRRSRFARFMSRICCCCAPERDE